MLYSLQHVSFILWTQVSETEGLTQASQRAAVEQ